LAVKPGSGTFVLAGSVGLAAAPATGFVAMAVFFTADTHFGHSGARTLYRRPIASTSEMNAVMESNWNQVVRPNDTVWHLGDFALRTKTDAAAGLLRRLHGQKHLIIGNNDNPEITALPGWSSVHSYVEMELDGLQLVLCHYAFRTWNGMSRGALNLHGHSHGRLKPMPRQIDVGVDVWGFRPISPSDFRERPKLALGGTDESQIGSKRS
jgi:calcineurin-like phosphoesterase family protein